MKFSSAVLCVVIAVPVLFFSLPTVQASKKEKMEKMEAREEGWQSDDYYDDLDKYSGNYDYYDPSAYDNSFAVAADYEYDETGGLAYEEELLAPQKKDEGPKEDKKEEKVEKTMKNVEKKEELIDEEIQEDSNQESEAEDEEFAMRIDDTRVILKSMRPYEFGAAINSLGHLLAARVSGVKTLLSDHPVRFLSANHPVELLLDDDLADVIEDVLPQFDREILSARGLVGLKYANETVRSLLRTALESGQLVDMLQHAFIINDAPLIPEPVLKAVFASVLLWLDVLNPSGYSIIKDHENGRQWCALRALNVPGLVESLLPAHEGQGGSLWTKAMLPWIERQFSRLWPDREDLQLRGQDVSVEKFGSQLGSALQRLLQALEPIEPRLSYLHCQAVHIALAACFGPSQSRGSLHAATNLYRHAILPLVKVGGGPFWTMPAESRAEFLTFCPWLANVPPSDSNSSNLSIERTPEELDAAIRAFLLGFSQPYDAAVGAGEHQITLTHALDGPHLLWPFLQQSYSSTQMAVKLSGNASLASLTISNDGQLHLTHNLPKFIVVTNRRTWQYEAARPGLIVAVLSMPPGLITADKQTLRSFNEHLAELLNTHRLSFTTDSNLPATTTTTHVFRGNRVCAKHLSQSSSSSSVALVDDESECEECQELTRVTRHHLLGNLMSFSLSSLNAAVFEIVSLDGSQKIMQDVRDSFRNFQATN